MAVRRQMVNVSSNEGFPGLEQPLLQCVYSLPLPSLRIKRIFGVMTAVTGRHIFIARGKLVDLIM